jgi:hypothetical protein
LTNARREIVMLRYSFMHTTGDLFVQVR